MIDDILTFIGKYITLLFNELGDIAQYLDGTGWAGLAIVLVVSGWFFLKGNTIRST
ncbi:MAG: hypothetical protein AB8B55_06890 [Mariniblastus sp.]